jgi:hypothetical protein
MSGDQRPVLMVLDTSAILAYTRGSIHVGEPIAEVDSDGGVVGIPALCLAEVSWMVNDADRLKLLADHHATRVVAETNWVGLGENLSFTGRVDCASAALTAVIADCDVLTAQPGLYGGMAGGGPVIPLPR